VRAKRCGGGGDAWRGGGSKKSPISFFNRSKTQEEKQGDSGKVFSPRGTRGRSKNRRKGSPTLTALTARGGEIRREVRTSWGLPNHNSKEESGLHWAGEPGFSGRGEREKKKEKGRQGCKKFADKYLAGVKNLKS